MSDERLGITFGGMAAPIAEQLRRQGATIDPDLVAARQRQADAIRLLNIGGVLIYSEVTRARKRLVKMIAAEVTR